MGSVSMAVSSVVVSSKIQPTSDAFFSPLPLKKTMPVKVASGKGKFRVEVSLKERAVARVTAAAVAASLVVPEVAQAADSLTPSLKNFLLSIGAGGIVLGAIAGAIVGVSNFDPVKRG